MKSEARMMNRADTPKGLFRHSSFVTTLGFVIGHSGLRIAVCSIQMAAQRTGDRGNIFWMAIFARRDEFL